MLLQKWVSGLALSLKLKMLGVGLNVSVENIFFFHFISVPCSTFPVKALSALPLEVLHRWFRYT